MLKKLLVYTVMWLSFLLILCSCSTGTSMNDKLIRFHVIANSDSPDDQSVKLRVRDEVLKEIGSKLEYSKSKRESSDIINNNILDIKTVAQSELIKNGKDYNVAVSLVKSSFPAKMYSNITLPAGEYDALKIVLGKGDGKNWWCVMFPPLCFIDITRGVTSMDTENRLKTVLNDNQYDSILSSTNDKNSEAVKKPIISDSNKEKQPEKIEMKFKSFEVIKYMFGKVEKLFFK